MALSMDIGGLGYHRMGRVSMFDPDEATCILGIMSYENQSARLAGDDAKAYRSIPVNPESFAGYFADSVLKAEGKSQLSQGYLYLKSLPEWSSAADC